MATPIPSFGPSRAARHRRILLRRLLAVAAIMAALVLTVQVVRPDAPAEREVHVAVRDLPAGHRLTTGDLRTLALPADLPTLTHAAAGQDLPGRMLATAIAGGELLTTTRLVPRAASEGLPDGTAPLHVVVSDPRMLDLVGPGQRVCVHRARTGGLLADDVLVLGIDPPNDTEQHFGSVGGAERGLVLALPITVIDEALASPEPDGLVPRVHVVPSVPVPVPARTDSPTPAGEATS